jgi:16S rRNA (guanine1516-N2)-methyltransferase
MGGTGRTSSGDRCSDADSTWSPPSIAVCADPPGDADLAPAAVTLGAHLNLPVVSSPDAAGFEMLLVVTAERLELRVVGGDPGLRGGRGVAAELDSIDTHSPAGRSLKQPIAKAVGVRGARERGGDPLTVLDATAGWGGDAWLLATLGCRVLAVERHRVIAAMLSDAVRRCAAETDRMTVVCAEGREVLGRIAAAAGAFIPDVVYLDPMFPGAETRKTAERKAMRVLRRLVGADADAGELFDAALAVARRRVVVKRPLHAGELTGPGSAGRAPDLVFRGKSLRYDVYLITAMA